MDIISNILKILHVGSEEREGGRGERGREGEREREGGERGRKGGEREEGKEGGKALHVTTCK